MRTAPEKYGKFSAQLFYCTGFVVLYRSSSEIYTYCKCIQPLLINKFSYYHGTREVGVNHYTFCLCARLSYRTGFHFSAIFFWRTCHTCYVYAQCSNKTVTSFNIAWSCCEVRVPFFQTPPDPFASSSPPSVPLTLPQF